MLGSISSAVLLGAEGHPITVEVHIANGLPGFNVVGLPDESVRESRDRVRAAVMSSGQPWPSQRVTVNLAPSSGRKSGAGLDLAIALGVLVASAVIPAEAVGGLGVIGELGLDGSLRPVPGVAPMVGSLGDRDIVVPVESAGEARVAALGSVHLIAHLGELVDVLTGIEPWPCHEPPTPPPMSGHVPDLAEVHGQRLARHALEIAAAGAHHLLFIGPPGSGKTMLASRLAGILPPLDRSKALEATMIHSAAGVALPPDGLVVRPPYRSPHHTASKTAICGGGSHTLQPGEVSIAHGGVLFLDEIAEFAPNVLETLRQSLEARVARVDRAKIRAVIPADFLLVAAMNPCPCGGGPPGTCACGDAQLNRYARRLSGPLLDRFDLRVGVNRPAVDELLDDRPGESSTVVARRVEAARDRALLRQGVPNSALAASELDHAAPVEAAARLRLRYELEHERLSGRGYHRIRRVARTIADLRDDSSDIVTEQDIALALEMRTALTRAFPIGRSA